MPMQIKAGDRWRRIGLSFASAIVAEVLVAIDVAFIDGRHLLFEHIFGFLYFASILVVPGWLLALPIILQQRFYNLSVWLRVLIGTLIGPTIMVGIGIYGGLANSSGFGYSREAYNLLYIATGISFLASAIYLAALEYFSKGSAGSGSS
jgi:hypothetical protein